MPSFGSCVSVAGEISKAKQKSKTFFFVYFCFFFVFVCCVCVCVCGYSYQCANCVFVSFLYLSYLFLTLYNMYHYKFFITYKTNFNQKTLTTSLPTPTPPTHLYPASFFLLGAIFTKPKPKPKSINPKMKNNNNNNNNNNNKLGPTS